MQYFRRVRNEVKTYRKFPAEIGYTEDLYTWQGRSREIICLELDFFSRLDGDAARAIDAAMTARRIPTDAHSRSSIIRFILSLMHRTPYQVAAFRRGHAGLWRQPDAKIQEKYDSLKRDWYPADVSEFILANDPDAIDRAFMRQLVEAINHKRVGQFMINLNWDLRVCAHAKYEFLIGDFPAVWSNGLDKPDGHCCLALSPNALLMITRNLEIRHQLWAMSDSQITRAYNKQVARGSRLFAIATDEAQRIFIEKHLDVDPIVSWAEKLETKNGMLT